LLPSRREARLQKLVGCNKLYFSPPRIGKDIDKEKERILIEDDPSGHGTQDPVM
jgi:hypothetical protein